MNNIDLNTITIAEAKELGVEGMDLFTVIRNPINSATLKKNEEYAAALPQQAVKIKRSASNKPVIITEGAIEEKDTYSAVKINSTILNAFIRWNNKTTNNNQVWIKPNVVSAFKQANPDVIVTDFNPNNVSAGNTEPYIGGGFVENVSKDKFIQLVNAVIK